VPTKIKSHIWSTNGFSASYMSPMSPIGLIHEASMKLKMYVLVKGSIPVGNAIVAAAHGPLSLYLNFPTDPDMVKWLQTSFAKVVCKVTDEEFEKAKEVPKHQVITESTLNGQEVAIVFIPREEYPKNFGFFPKYK